MRVKAPFPFSGALTLVLGVLVVIPNRTQAEPLSDDSTRCEALTDADLSGIQDAPTQVTNTRLAPATRTTPSYCLVEGYVVPQIGFELRLPSPGWNGKLLVVGSGGWGGFLYEDDCDRYLRRGYACIGSDTGHKGTGDDGLWASHNLQAQVDFGYRSVHVATLAGKSIVERYYTRAPQQSYFVGCSTGGYEGLVEAQHFPWDFDGIIAGAPDMDEADLAMRLVWNVRSFNSKSGQPAFSTSDIQVLHHAVLDACDMDDGVKDGVVGNPVSCRFDPGELRCGAARNSASCLTQLQIDAAVRIYTGASNSKGKSVSTRGLLPGSELSWIDKFSGRNGLSMLESAESFFRYMLYGVSPDWKARDFDFDRDYTRIGLAVLYNNTNPDLRKFKAAGGKLIVYQGGSDSVEVPGAILDYYTTAERTMGGRASAQEFFRFFVIPGMDHCTGGVGAYAIDYLTYLEDWVEQHKAPDVLLGAHVRDSYLATLPLSSRWQFLGTTPQARVLAGPWELEFPLKPDIPVAFTRPVYPYPLFAKFRGYGDPNDGANFGPVSP